MSAHEREKHLHFLPGGSDRRSFFTTRVQPPFKGKELAWGLETCQHVQQWVVDTQ